jgi:hypothetical protein
VIVHTIMTQPGQDAPGKCAGFTGPPRPGGQCTRCGRPDYAHQAGGRERQARIGELDSDQMTMALTFLAGYNPPVLDVVLDATRPCDDEPAGDYGPEPYCTVCSAPTGIFAAYGGDWRHYRWDYAPGTKPVVYEAGHAPVIRWRPARSPESAVAF